jgi:hypothetical protein
MVFPLDIEVVYTNDEFTDEDVLIATLAEIRLED